MSDFDDGRLTPDRVEALIARLVKLEQNVTSLLAKEKDNDDALDAYAEATLRARDASLTRRSG